MFRPRRPLPRPDLCCPSSRGPVSSRLSLISATLPAHTATLLRRERLPLPPVTSHQSQITKSFTIRTCEKQARNSFRISTYKTHDLKPFRINTYRKTGEGVPSHYAGSSRRGTTRRALFLFLALELGASRDCELIHVVVHGEDVIEAPLVGIDVDHPAEDDRVKTAPGVGASVFG